MKKDKLICGAPFRNYKVSILFTRFSSLKSIHYCDLSDALSDESVLPGSGECISRCQQTNKKGSMIWSISVCQLAS